MRMHCRLLLAALASTVVLGLLASPAIGNRAIQIEPSGSFQAEGPVTFVSSPVGNRFVALLTLRGSLHRSIAKTMGSLAGVITDCRMTLGIDEIMGRYELRCALALPWHLRFGFWAPSLPNIGQLGMSALSASVRVTALSGTGIECLYLGGVSVTTSGIPIRSLRIGPTDIPTTTPELEFCREPSHERIRFSGTLNLEIGRTPAMTLLN